MHPRPGVCYRARPFPGCQGWSGILARTIFDIAFNWLRLYRRHRSFPEISLTLQALVQRVSASNGVAPVRSRPEAKPGMGAKPLPQSFRPLPPTAAFSVAPGRNFGAFDAGIAISAPVRGLRPVRAPCSTASKLPKPVRRMSSPRARVSVTESSHGHR